MTAPPLLVAARSKFLTSDDYRDLRARGLIGLWQQPPVPWVFTSLDRRNGLPWQYGKGRAAIVFYLRAASWTRGDTSARYPKLGATVWLQGDAGDRSTEYIARDVANAVINVFDDPAGEAPPTWGPEVFVIRCRWDGELSVSDVEDLPGLLRADFGFELETC